MNICFCIGTLSYSGAEKIMLNLIKEFYKRSHAVSVILLSCSQPYEFLEGINQYPLYNIEDASIKNTIVRVIKREKRIRKVIKEGNFDIVVSFGVKFNIDVAEACLLTKTKLVLCERNDPINDPTSKILRLRRKIIYNRADGFVFQTNKIKNFFSKKIQSRSLIIPNFIHDYVNKNNLTVDKRMSFATCARLDDNQKNHTALINAFAKFCEGSFEKYYLEFYGDGPDKYKYKKLIKELGIEDRVIFHGRIDNPMEEIKYCKFFIFTSRYEGMPNALIEAMSYGMPCIATDCGGGGAAELIESGVNGLLIQYGDEKQLLNAMKYYASNYEMAVEMGKNAYKINEKLEKNKIINRWENAIEEWVKS